MLDANTYRWIAATVTPPNQMITDRLVLSRWAPGDAPGMKAAVDASLAHLGARASARASVLRSGRAAALPSPVDHPRHAAPDAVMTSSSLPPRRFWFVVAAGLAADWLTKWVANALLVPGRPVPVLGSLVRLKLS